MHAGKREFGFTVVKMIIAPTRGLVATGACFARIPFFINLAVVYVLVAVYTLLPQSLEFPLLFVGFVASKTRRGHVGTFQHKPRFLVVLQRITALLKRIHRMAFGAIGRRNGITRKFAFVVILMAGRTGIMRKRIGHFFGDVAFFAIHRHVFAFEGKSRSIVVEFAFICHFSKRIFIVALGAVGAQSPFVGVFVAGITVGGQHTFPVLKNREWRGIHFMAFATICLFVFTFQGKQRFAVVEPAQAAFVLKGLFRVAFFTVITEVVFVRIVVATVAIFKSNTFKYLKLRTIFDLFFVAFDAVHIFVFPNQGKVGFVVVKLGGGGKFIGGMTLRAVVSQGFLVPVGMASIAVLNQSQKGFRAFFQARIADIIGLVALAAIDVFVAAGELIAGEVVFKIFLIKPHHVKFAAVVVAVAGSTIFAFYLRRGVVPHIPIDAVFDFLVAGHTFFIRQAVADVVALGAFRHAFQILVRIGQVARRQLSHCLCGEARDEKQYINNLPHVTCVF